MDPTLLSLSIKVFQFEFEFFLSLSLSPSLLLNRLNDDSVACKTHVQLKKREKVVPYNKALLFYSFLVYCCFVF